MNRVGKKKWYGQTRYSDCEIDLSSRCKSDEELAHTFLHELNHAIFCTMSREKLNNDEALVDGHASLLLQVLMTAR